MEKNITRKPYLRPEALVVEALAAPLMAGSLNTTDGNSQDTREFTPNHNGWTEGYSKGHGLDPWADDEEEE